MNKKYVILFLCLVSVVVFFQEEEYNQQSSVQSFKQIVRPSKVVTTTPAMVHKITLDHDLLDRLRLQTNIDEIRTEIENFESSFPVEAIIQRLNQGLASQEERDQFSQFLKIKFAAYEHLLNQEIYEMEELVL